MRKIKRSLKKPINPEYSLLSKEAKLRFKWMEHFRKYRSARLTCRHFGISPDTFYLWKRRFEKNNLVSLEDPRSKRRPKRLRTKTWTEDLVHDTLLLKKQHPSFGREKIKALLIIHGYLVSASTVGRIINHHKHGKLD